MDLQQGKKTKHFGKKNKRKNLTKQKLKKFWNVLKNKQKLKNCQRKKLKKLKIWLEKSNNLAKWWRNEKFWHNAQKNPERTKFAWKTKKLKTWKTKIWRNKKRAKKKKKSIKQRKLRVKNIQN